MTQEEKQILLADLCARLPYGVKITFNHNGFRWDWEQTLHEIGLCDDGEYSINGWGIHGIKPYLRPMSSMTEEEKNELRNILWFGYPSDDNDNYSHRGIEVKQCLYDDEKHSTYDFDDFRDFQNFLLKNHFDYRGLIEMGLALEAPEDMYK